MARSKRGFMDVYTKTYDPYEEGYGDSHQWRQAFNFRMGLDAAKAKVGDKSPRGILGVSLMKEYTMLAWTEIKTAWRKLVMTYHTDNAVTGDKETFLSIQAAYEILFDEFERHGVKVK